MNEQKINENKEVNDRNVISFLFSHYRTHLIAWTALFLLFEKILWNHPDENYRTLVFSFYLIIFIIYVAIASSRVEDEFWKQFAADHNYVHNKDKNEKENTSRYCEIGRNRHTFEKVRGAENGKPIVFSSFLSVVGRNKTEEMISFTLCELKLSGNIPPFVVLSKKSEKSFILDLRTIPDYRKLTLEGDFNKFFSVYTIPGKERGALEILTPDIMVELIEYSPLFSFEFNKDTVFVYAGKNIAKRAELEKMRTACLYLAEKLSPVYLSSI